MGEGDTVPEKRKPVSNGNAEIEEIANRTEAMTEKKDQEMKLEDGKMDDMASEAQDMDVDKEEVKVSKGSGANIEDDKVAKEGNEEENELPEGEEKEKANRGKEEINSETTEDNSGEKPKETEDKAEEEVDEMKEVNDREEERTQEKQSKKRPRTKSGAGKKEKGKKKEAEEKEKEPKTPTAKKSKEPKTPAEKKESKTPMASTIERPVRERKSVERLVAIIEKDDAKEFQIEKGRGTALKDIPNVAYKLSRKKTEDTFKLLHTILFGRRGKATQVKNNISRFSGFVWHDNEEKQMLKVKEKLDKFVKEKLVEFCDVLDIPISKANTRKEDMIMKLIDFLVSPHATTTELLAEKEQGKKRKRVSKSESRSSTPSKGTTKSRKKTESASKKVGDKKSLPVSEDDSEEGEEEKREASEEENVNGISERSEDEMSDEGKNQEKRSESKDKFDEDKENQKRGSKKGTGGQSKTKKITMSQKASPPKNSPAKSPPGRSKNNNDTSAKKSKGKKKDEETKEKLTTPKKNATKESTAKGKKVEKKKDKPKEDKLKPSDDELKNAICDILKDVDFNTATFTDILKLLAKRFNTDLIHRKSSIKLMIQNELTKLADEQDDEEDEVDAENDEKQPPSQGVKA